MFRSLVSTARRQRFVAFLSVIALALTVPPAFGAPSVAAQVKSALKLAKKADKNATTALNLAKSASKGSGSDGAKGATGPAGPSGPAGPAGPKGDTGTPGATGATGPIGPAGTPGAKGDKGDTGAQGLPGEAGAVGATGATGATGAQGIPGEDGNGGGAPLSFVSSSTTDLESGLESIAYVDVAPNQAYIVTAHVKVTDVPSAAGVICEITQGTVHYDMAQTAATYNGRIEQTLTSLIPAGASPQDISIDCSSDFAGAPPKASVTLTGVPVGS